MTRPAKVRHAWPRFAFDPNLSPHERLGAPSFQIIESRRRWAICREGRAARW
jgi:hypothetical protein